MPDLTVQDLIRREASRQGVPAALALAVAEQESNFDPTVVNPTSGAVGTFQFIPATAKARGINAQDPIQNIVGGVGYLRELLDQTNGDLDKVLRTYGGVKTDQSYVPSVIGRLQKYMAASGMPTSPELEGSRLIGQMKADANAPPRPRTPGAIPPPSSLERTRPQEIVEGLRKYSVLPTVGSIAGGTAGAVAGGPSIVGIPAAAVAGSATGAGLGETAQIGLEKAVGLDSGPPIPRIVREGAFGAAGEVGGQVVAKGVTKVAAPFAKKVTTEGVEALRALKGRVLPAQTTESRTLDIVQNVAEASLFGGGKIKAFKETQDRLVKDLVDKEVAKYGGATAGETAGEAFVKGLEGQISGFHQQANQLYGALDQAAQGIQVNTTALKQWAAQELSQRGLVPALSGDKTLSVLKGIVDMPDVVPFQQAANVRSQALSLGRSLLDPERDVLRGVTSQITKHTDEAMETAAQQAGPQFLQQFRTTNAFYKAGKEKFETDFLRGLIEKEPDAVAKSLTRNNSPVLIREARNAVPATSWKPVQAALATQLVESATNVETQAISGKAMLTKIKQLGASMPEIFPRTHDEVKRLARVLSVVQQKQGEGTGRMAIQLAQAGTAVGIVTGSTFAGSPLAGAAGASAIMLGPRAVAQILTSPRGIRWLTTGLTAPPGTALAARAASNLATFLSVGEADRSEEAEDDQGPPRPSTLRTQSTVRTSEGPPAPSFR